MSKADVRPLIRCGAVEIRRPGVNDGYRPYGHSRAPYTITRSARGSSDVGHRPQAAAHDPRLCLLASCYSRREPYIGKKWEFSMLVASPLVMWLGVDRSQFVQATKKKTLGDENDGAVV